MPNENRAPTARRKRLPLQMTVRSCTALIVCLSVSAFAQAQEESALPAPLDVRTVMRLARQRRAEVAAARARAHAANERPRVVAALPDPMLMVQADFLPLDFRGVNGSITVQQEFPLSGVLGDRRRAARADAERWGAETRRVALDVELEALQAFFMLAERRETTAILNEQIGLTEQLLVIARAHYAAGQGMQADVLRLENEAARLRSDRRALAAEIRGAEAMLDTVLAREPTAPVPQLAWTDELNEPPGLEILIDKAIANRPELAGARAERRRALAEIDAMKSMYSPMALVRLGPAYMMSEGAGVMAMVGVSVPIWRSRLSGGVSEARWMASMASADISAMQRMIAGNIAVARENVRAELTRLSAIQKDILPRARQVVTSAIGGFAAGQGPMLSVLDSARDLREIRVQEVMARARLSMAWAKLRRELGE